MTSPWPQPLLPPYDFDFDAFFMNVQLSIRESRALRNLPPLIPDNRLLVGKEWLAANHAPPRIVVVPNGFRYSPAQKFLDPQAPLGAEELWSWWALLEVHCWGPETKDPIDALDGYSSCAELARQFLAALQLEAGGVARVKIDGSEFVQKTDINRSGRTLNLSCSFQRPLRSDPPATVIAKTEVEVTTSTTADVVFQVP